MSRDAPALARAMPTNEIVPAPNRAKKTVLVLFSGASAQDSKLLEYAKAFLLEDVDDVFVAHFVRGATSTVYGPGRIAGSIAVDDDAVRSRPGVRVVALARDDAGGDATTPAAEWLSEYARAELLDRRISHPTTLVRCVQIDSMSGKFSVEEALDGIVRGEFSREQSRNDDWVDIPIPSLIVMGCRGHGLVRRALLGSVTQNVLNRIPVSTCFFRSTLPEISGHSDLVKQKLGGIDQRVVCISMSGSNSSRRLVEYFVEEHQRASDVVLLLHCSSESQKKEKDLTDSDIEENMCRAYDLVSSFQKQQPHSCGRVVRMTLEKDTGSASDIRDRTIDFLNLTDVNLLVVGRAVSSSHLRSRFMSPFPQYAVTHAPCPVLVWNPPPLYARSHSQTTSTGAETSHKSVSAA